MSRLAMTRIRLLATLVLATMVFGGSRYAEARGSTRVLIDYIDVLGAPEFKIYTDFLNPADRPIRRLEARDVTLLLDGEPYEDEIGITQFKKSDEAVAFVLLFNNYRGYSSVHEQQKKGLSTFIRGMRTKDVAALVVYADKAIPVVDFTSDKDELLQAISAFPKPEKPQEVFIDAVIIALDTFPEDTPSFPRRRGLVMLSDALDQGLADRGNLAKRIKSDLAPKAKALGVKFYGLGYSIESKDGLKLMSMLAKNMDGSFRSIRDAELNRLGEFFTKMLDMVYGQYIISFITDDLDPEEPHTLQVNINHKGNLVESVPEEFQAPEVPGTPWWVILLIILGGVFGLFLIVGIIVAIARRGKRGEEEDEDDEEDEDEEEGERECPVCGEIMEPEWRACEYCLQTSHIGELTVIGGKWDGFIYVLCDEITTIGSREGDIIIDDSTVSGKHAGIKVDDMKFELADFGSTNGTFVNGKSISKQFLKDGDSIKFGKVDLKFSLA